MKNLNDETNTRPLQIQIWDARAKAYRVHGDIPEKYRDTFNTDGLIASVRALACGRPWRIAHPKRPLKPRYTHSRRLDSDRSIGTVQAAYVAWANAHGLASITCFYADEYLLRKFGFKGRIVTVDPRKYFRVHEETNIPEK